MEHAKGRRFLIVHGVGNHRPPGHWQYRLAEALRVDHEVVLYPQFPDADAPQLDRWLALLHAELEQLGSGERVVICHSLGCLLWLHHVVTASPQQAVDRVLLVSPPSPTILWPAIKSFATQGDLHAEHVACAARSETRMVASTSDPYCPESARSLYAAPLGIEIDVLPTGGHLSESDGYGPWPSVVAWCRDPTTRLTENAQGAPPP
ncbi:MAG: alpha/beta fold hydrolase [Candidatus Dormibacteria bacterium]|jgi:predicted alpha/beta hydrolase family esterase